MAGQDTELPVHADGKSGGNKHGKPPVNGRDGFGGDSNSSSSEGGQEETNRTPSEFINITYDHLVDWLGAWLTNQKPPEWIKSWSVVFRRQLPLHTFLRTQSAFKSIVSEYAELDPKRTEEMPLTSALPDKAARRERRRAKRALHKELKSVSDKHNPQGTLSQAQERFMHGRLKALLHTCGFERLPEGFFNAARTQESRSGLDVHIPSQNEVPCHIYYRDDYTKQKVVHSLSSCFKAQEVTERYLRHVVLVYAWLWQKDDAPDGCCDKLQWMCKAKAKRRAIGPPESEGKVYIHCFNDIPLLDLDMLLPGTSPNPKILDTLIVVVPFLFGFGVAIYKIVDIFLHTDDLTDVSNLMVILFAIVAPFTVSIKAFIKGKSKLTKYRCDQAEMLVDHTVSANRGTMMQLMAEAADQENKEAVLCYTTLAAARDPEDEGGVRRRCNALLQTMSPGCNTDFDAGDTVPKLLKHGMLESTQHGAVQTVDVDKCKAELSLEQFQTPKPPRLRTHGSEA